jgi:prolyl oligopeptidase
VNALTRRVEVVEEHFGQTIADRYRWLEADARSDAEVAAWVSAQNRLTWQRADHVSGKPMDRALGEIRRGA